VHVLHAIHDFLPRHRAGSEIYAHALACAQLARHHVTVACAEFDPQRAHGHVEWRVHECVPVVEIVNNWVATSFEDTYRPELIGQRLDQLLEVLRPDILHVHNLLNLSFELPAMARARGIPVVATVHDYTLVCPSGGQRIHKKDAHVCHQVDTSRCARCFAESPFYSQMSVAALTTRLAGRSALWRTARTVGRLFPQLVRHGQRAIAHSSRVTHGPDDIDARLVAARKVLDQFDLVVTPSRSIAREFEAFGLNTDRLVVSDYGFVPMPSGQRPRHPGPVRIGFVGTLVWHKGLHILLQAVAPLDPQLYEVVICGDTQTFPDYTSELRKLAAGLPVRFMGAFDGDQMADVYANIDVLVVPSL
jgi:glycosyltransferase involved in cell wall biosynthesis